MSRTWLIIEKIIAVLIAVWGMFALYSITLIIFRVVHTGYSNAMNTTNFQIVLIYHLNFLLALASMFAGALLMFNDKDGWLLSIICSGMYALAFFVSSRVNSKDAQQPYFEFFKSYSLIALLFLAIFILLVQKPFRKKYYVTARNWVIVTLIMIVLVVDKLVF